MTVYIVMANEENDAWVDAVYTDRGKAEDYAASFNTRPTRWYSVEDWEMTE